MPVIFGMCGYLPPGWRRRTFGASIPHRHMMRKESLSAETDDADERRHGRMATQLAVFTAGLGPVGAAVTSANPIVWSILYHPAWQPGQALIAAQAARAEGPPGTRPRRMDQSREAHRSARPLHSPEGGIGRGLRGASWLLQVVADYTPPSAVQAGITQLTGARRGRNILV